jgi:hypothetical protein
MVCNALDINSILKEEIVDVDLHQLQATPWISFPSAISHRTQTCFPNEPDHILVPMGQTVTDSIVMLYQRMYYEQPLQNMTLSAAQHAKEKHLACICLLDST